MRCVIQYPSAHRIQWLGLGCFFTIGLVGVLRGDDKTQQRDNQKPDVTTAAQGRMLKDVPETIEAAAKYLFYLHGKIVEDQGPRPTSEKYGVYEYQRILDTFRDKGFLVISEVRGKNTDPKNYAIKVTGQIQALLKAGVPAQHITVVGASKGAIIAMLVSTNLKNRDVNFVLLSDCNDDVLKRFNIDLWGNVLSIYDVNDEFGQSCGKFFDKASGLNKRKEIELKLGTGHAILYRPINEWIEPTLEWAQQSGD